MRLVPLYRGVRVRPYMRKMDILLFIFFFCLCSLPIGYYAYVHLLDYQNLNRFVISVTVGLIVLSGMLSVYLTWFLQEANPFFKRLERLKRLARFLFEHGYTYEKRKKQGQSSVSFPKIYLKQGKYDLSVSFEMAGGKYQDRFKKIGGNLEDTFFMDFMETTDESRFKIFKLAYSAYLNRINTTDVEYVPDKGLKLMDGLYWDFVSDPHLLVAGGTGGGKTVFLRTLILALSKIGVVDICDPKRADFVTMGDIPAFEGRVYFEMEDIVSQFEKAVVVMMARYDFMRSEMKRLKHKDLKRYDEYGLEPYFFVCDEYNALKAMLKFQNSERVDDAIGQLLLLGRQAGCFGIIAMQKPAREDLGSKLQANINFRISVGRLDEGGYDTLFGTVNRNKEFKYLKYLSGIRVYGRGYCSVYGEVAREFYSPVWKKGFSFTEHYEKLERIPNRFDPTENESISSDIVEDDNLKQFVIQVSKGQLIEADNDEDKNVENEEFYYVADIAKDVDKPTSAVRKVALLIEEKGNEEYQISKEGKKIFTFEQMMDICTLFEQKEDFNRTWEELVDLYYE